MIVKTATAVFLLLLTLVIYLPGLGSRFLLDDYYNLGNLDQVAAYGYRSFVFSSGFSGPSGRPLSLFTFALQYASWPDHPAAFKIVNVCLHLVNGVLIFIFCDMLAWRVIKARNQQLLLTTLATFLWLLHPIQVSTALYVVQRMTELSTLFTLTGIVAYLYFRQQMVPGRNSNRTLLILSITLPICTLLATLAKENGILLPLYLLIIEGTLLVKLHRAKSLIIWKWIFLIGPLVILAVYLASGVVEVSRSYASQEYSMGQKTLTEAVVVTEYIKNIFLPHPAAFSLYHDDFPVSQGLFTPPATFLAIVVLVVMTAAALYKRKTQPVLSFSILWFLGGHLLESSHLNLEIYFEHRNYLPAFGLFFLSAWIIAMAAESYQRKWLIYTAAGIFGLQVMVTTIMEIDLWSKPGVQAMEWARRHPRSERALQDLLQYYLINNEHEKVGRVLTSMQEIAPEHIYPALDKIHIYECRMHQAITDSEWNDYLERAGRVKADGLKSVVILDQLVLNRIKGLCLTTERDKLNNLIIRLIGNPEFSGAYGFLYEYLSALAVYAGNYVDGLNYIRLSLQTDYTVPRKLQEIRILSLLGESELARAANTELREHIRNDYRLWWGYGRMIEMAQIK